MRRTSKLRPSPDQRCGPAKPLPRVPRTAGAVFCCCWLRRIRRTWVYVSNADSQEISVLELDRAQGAQAVLRPVQTLNVGGTVMPMVVSHDKRVLYAALRSQPFRVTALSIDAATGKLKKLGEAPLADSMANIDLDASGQWLFAASYQGGKITVNAVGKDGTSVRCTS
jgi:6-phosphogluconolactonase